MASPSLNSNHKLSSAHRVTSGQLTKKAIQGKQTQIPPMPKLESSAYSVVASKDLKSKSLKRKFYWKELSSHARNVIVIVIVIF